MTTAPPTKKSLKILIADDSAPIRKMIRSLLEDVAGEIIEAADGQAAIEACDQHKPDWVTLDLAMGPVDGLVVAQELNSRHPLVRVLIVTDHDVDAFREAARLAGAIEYILKDDLCQVRDFIAGACAAASPAGASQQTADLEGSGEKAQPKSLKPGGAILTGMIVGLLGFLMNLATLASALPVDNESGGAPAFKISRAPSPASGGLASWYGEEHRGRLMANGRPFNPDKLSCASWHYPLGTQLVVRHGSKAVLVIVTDRGPAKHLNRAIDLSRAAFCRLADAQLGILEVVIEPRGKPVSVVKTHGQSAP